MYQSVTVAVGLDNCSVETELVLEVEEHVWKVSHWHIQEPPCLWVNRPLSIARVDPEPNCQGQPGQVRATVPEVSGWIARPRFAR